MYTNVFMNKTQQIRTKIFVFICKLIHVSIVQNKSRYLSDMHNVWQIQNNLIIYCYKLNCYLNKNYSLIVT